MQLSFLALALMPPTAAPAMTALTPSAFSAPAFGPTLTRETLFGTFIVNHL